MLRCAALCLLLPGCFNPYGEILAEHISPNGFVRVSMDGAPEKASTGLVSAKIEPLAINGYSADLTFGLIGGDDPLGSTALNAMAKPDTSVEMKLTPATRTQLQIFTGGSGCRATAGTIKLTSHNTAKHLNGTFDATGVRPDKVTPCTISGTLTDIPIER